MKKNIKSPTTPSDLKNALAAKPWAEAVWKSLTPLAKWDFIIYINQTREPDTRKKRINKSISLLNAGKRRPCCFTIVPADLYKALKSNPKANSQWKGLGAVERRNFVTWIDSAKQSSQSKTRSQKACVLLAAGKQHP